MSAKTKTRRPRAPAPVNESKADKFKRLGSVRLKKIVSQVLLFGNLSSSSYQYTQEQVDKAKAAIQGALDDSFSRFVPRDQQQAAQQRDLSL